MDDTSIRDLLEIVIASAAGGYALFYVALRARTRWLLRRTPLTPIALFEHGAKGKIVGHVRSLGEPLVAPFSGRECVHFEVIVQEYHHRRKAGYWSTVLEKSEGEDFLLVDGDAEALVCCEGARLALDRDRRYGWGVPERTNPRLEVFLASHSQTSVSFGFERRLRYREAVLEEGECVAVHGVGRWRDVSDDGENVPGRRLVFEATDDVPLYVSDHHSTLN